MENKEPLTITEWLKRLPKSKKEILSKVDTNKIIKKLIKIKRKNNG